jgi:tetraacyldisaccharide 4'-kinase
MGRLVYWLLWGLLGPLVGVVSWIHPRTRFGWGQRWGMGVPTLEPGCIWIHAVSVGEGRAAEAVILALREAGCQRVILRTATSREGIETARGQDLVAPCPMDHPWVVRRWLDRVRPGLLVLVEAELWPHLLFAAKARGIPVLVAGVRMGPGARRFRRFAPGVLRACMGCVSRWLPGDVAAAEALESWGATSVRCVGQPKSDAPPGPALAYARPALVAGSTRAGEEAMLLEAVQHLEDAPLLVLAPRHPARFDEVAALLGAVGLTWCRRSALGDRVPEHVEVLLVDSMGELSGLYRGAAAAFVGGTFHPEIGGHSPAEPAACGIPLVSGPFNDAHRPLWTLLDAHVALEPGDLAGCIRAALASPAPIPLPGGAAGRVAQEVMEWVAVDPVQERTPRPWLAPLGWVWMAVMSYRNLFYSLRKGTRTKGHVVSVGSLGSGGAGKTPVSAWLAEYLGGQGISATVVARGYGRNRRGRYVRVPGSRRDADWLGDELAMLARRGVSVVSSPDRVAGAQVAFAQGAEVVVLDDGFQHRRIARDLDIVVVDGRWPKEGGPIPAGERREPVDAVRRADVLWVSAGATPESLAQRLKPGALVVRSQLQPVCWVRGDEELPLGELSNRSVCAFAGIARPGRFLSQLVGLGVRIGGWRTFADHHRFSSQEVRDLLTWSRGRPLVTTEKDRVRLPTDLEVWSLRVRCVPVEGVESLAQLLSEIA